MGLEADVGKSYAAIEEDVLGVRRVLGLASTDPLPGLELFELLERWTVGVDGMEYPLTYEVESLPSGVEARAMFDDIKGCFIVALAEATYAGLEAGEARARFSLAHEIGHVVEHPGQLIRLASIPHDVGAGLRRGSATHPSYRDTEWQANAFAGALLMPAPALLDFEGRGNLAADQVAEHFRVSPAAARIRLDVFRKKRDELIAVVDGRRSTKGGRG